MKIKRQKKVHRYLGFFCNNFGIRRPYQVLVDGTFSQAALVYKINIKEQLQKYLDAEVKFLTTACVITETEKLGPKLYGAMLIVKQFIVHKCGHEKNPISASDCLLSMLGAINSNHYFIATQDPNLRNKAKHISGVPILYLNYNAPIMEKPSSFCEKIVKKQQAIKFAPTQHETEMLKTLKEKHFGVSEMKPRIRKRKIKGPNPLSCKKSCKKQTASPVPPEKHARKRRRVRIAKHLKLADVADSGINE